MDWQGQGLCAYHPNPDLWLPEGHMIEQLSQEPKRICRECPVKQTCLDWALTHEEEYGVWGGLSEKERRAILYGTGSRRGRKFKTAV